MPVPFNRTDLTSFKTTFYHFPKPPQHSTSESDHYQDSLEVRREQRVLGVVSLIVGSHSLQRVCRRGRRGGGEMALLHKAQNSLT